MTATAADRMTSDRLRALGAARAAVGGLCLVGLAAGRPAAGAGLPRAGRVAAGVLAVRDLVQGAALVVRPERPVAEAAAFVDVLHAVSMLPVVAFARRYRVAAAVSTSEAAGWTWLALVALQPPGKHRGGSLGGRS
ncbi:MAG TPA: hypothetical protein VH857_00305 [Actinomycetes bacterium]|nr:hypothetical protein [Actinomycetes bacterium]